MLLREDGRFEVKQFPAAAACSDESVEGEIDGDGTWEYDGEDDRVFLKFSRISNERCKMPYGVMVFPQPHKKISVFLDADRPSTALVFEMEGN